MDWLPKDKATWGIILAVAAILISIPLNLVGNLLTPKVRNWWAERSATALKQRIAELQNKLAKANQYPFISDGESFILSIINGVILATGGVLISFWGMALAAFRALHGSGDIEFLLYAVAAFLFIMTLVYLLPRIIDKILERRSPYEREALGQNLKRLSDKLQAMEKS